MKCHSVSVINRVHCALGVCVCVCVCVHACVRVCVCPQRKIDMCVLSNHDK